MTTQNGLLIFVGKETHSEKIMEIVKDFVEKSYNNNVFLLFFPIFHFSSFFHFGRISSCSHLFICSYFENVFFRFFFYSFFLKFFFGVVLFFLFRTKSFLFFSRPSRRQNRKKKSSKVPVVKMTVFLCENTMFGSRRTREG